MKKLLLILSLLLPVVIAQALPFVPTTDPTLSSNYWYFLKTEGFYCAADDSEIAFRNSADASNDDYLWCFVGNSDVGYKLYNKGTGTYVMYEGLLYDSSYTNTYYEDKDGVSFYLKYYIPSWNVYRYLFMNTYQDQYGSMRYMDSDSGTKGVFSVEMAKEGIPIPADPTWTRFDKDGVGYGYIEGGNGAPAAEGQPSSHMCDNNADTKYVGYYSDCWFVMKASTDVAVKQYSIVTSDYSRDLPGRALRSWRLEGSNDCVNWVPIDEQTDYPMPFENRKEVVVKVNDNRKFRFFKFVATNSPAMYVQISEVWINEQVHNNIDVWSEMHHGCNHPITRTWLCRDCNVRGRYMSPPTTAHSYVDGVCTVCGLTEGETLLLYNGQALFPYYVKALHASRISENNWPSAPDGWNTVGFDDSNWIDLPLPMASDNHSGGPFELLQYNSYWYGQYNCYWMRRTFNIARVNPADVFTLRCVHDDNMVVYVNGQEVINAQGWTPNADNASWGDAYETFNIPATAFRPGQNVLAIYIQQNWGGAYFDCELTVKGSALTGDVNGDGEVSIADVTTLVDLLLHQQSNGRSDVNGDGETGIADLTSLVDILTN